MDANELKRAKEILNILKSNSSEKYDVVDEAISIINMYDPYSEFMDEYMLDERVKHEAESGAVRVMYFLANCEVHAPYGYMIDGYGNARNAELDDVVLALEELIENQ